MYCVPRQGWHQHRVAESIRVLDSLTKRRNIRASPETLRRIYSSRSMSQYIGS
jgi:hypothetical protein